MGGAVRGAERPTRTRTSCRTGQSASAQIGCVFSEDGGRRHGKLNNARSPASQRSRLAADCGRLMMNITSKSGATITKRGRIFVKNLDFTSLRLFAVVVEHGNIAQASRVNGIAASA